MPYRRLAATAVSSELHPVFDALRAEAGLGVDYPQDALAEAQALAEDPPLPECDRTDIPFVTIDPAESTDLDQAVHLERDGAGYRVWYAIADVPAFVRPGSALDRETRRRGQTVYCPDLKIPLHPEVLAEDKASLLPGQLRGAYVWSFALDGEGAVVDVGLERARVRSREKLDYAGVQRAVDSGQAPEHLMLLKEVGEKRIRQEQARGGASLAVPAQEVTRDDAGYHVVFRPPVPAENWNAQISLMTGMAAASIMLDGGVGILRTLPEPDQDTLEGFRRKAKALGHPWDRKLSYGDYLRTLDTEDPRQLAIMVAAGSLFRGAGYTVFDGAVPERTRQAAVAAPYAHTTAPLRRLVDRFVLAACEALVQGRPVPGWVRDSLPELPSLMAASDQVASKVGRECVNAVEAAVLADRVGEVFTATVVSVREGGSSGVVQLEDPAVEARVSGPVEAGQVLPVVLAEVDVAARTVRFAPQEGAARQGTTPTGRGSE